MMLQGNKTAAVLGFAILLLVGVAAYRNTVQFIDDSAWVNHTHEVMEALADLMSQLKDAETGQRGYLLTGNDRYLGPYKNAIDKVDRSVSRLIRLTADNPRQRRRNDHLADGFRLRRS